MCVFYLVLRALDTVEDDMAVPQEIKIPLLRAFHGKCYDRCGAPCLPVQLLHAFHGKCYDRCGAPCCCQLRPAAVRFSQEALRGVRRPSPGCDLCAARQQAIMSDGS